RYVQQAAVVGETERVIAGRCRDNAPSARLFRQAQEGVARTPLLEAARALQVIQLAMDVRTGQQRQRNGLDARRVVNAAGDAAACGDDVGQRYSVGSHVTPDAKRPASLRLTGPRLPARFSSIF